MFAAVQPSNAIGILALIGLILTAVRVRLGRVCLVAAAVLLIAFGFLPLGHLALVALEDQVPAPVRPEAVDTIVILGGYHASGGGVSEDEIAARQIPLNRHGDRLTTGAALAALYPAARIVVTDGGRVPGARLSATLLADFGIDPTRTIVEDRATSTLQNARFSLALVEPQETDRTILVTSAWHMPRAYATFRKAGWPAMIPWPVDAMGDGPIPWLPWPGSVANRLSAADLAAREYAATLYYYFTGRIDTLWPTPRG